MSLTTRAIVAAAVLVAAAGAAPGSAVHAQGSAFEIGATRLANDDLAFALLWGEPVYVPPAT